MAKRFSIGTRQNQALRRPAAERARRASGLLLTLLLLLGGGAESMAASHLQRFLKTLQPSEIVPTAERFGDPVGEPPVVPALRDGETIGQVFLNADFANAVGYSGKPIHIVVGLDPAGRVVGSKLVEHHEPIVLIGIPEHKITAVIDRYVGLDIPALARASQAEHELDIVSGATVTIMVIDDSILRSGIKVARRLGLGGLEPETERPAGPRMTLDMSEGEPLDWQTLLGDGSLRRLSLSLADINAAFEASGDLIAAQRPEEGAPEESFIALYAALVSIPPIGRSLLGDNEYRNLTNRLKPGQHAILLAGEGRYSFKGSGYVRGGIFDRFQMIQGDNSVRFRDKDHKRLGSIAAADAPDLPDVDLFRIPEMVEFDPTEPWRIELLVGRDTGPTDKAYLTFDLGYRPPDHFLIPVEAPAPSEAAENVGPLSDQPLWQRLWREKAWQVGTLGAALGVLTVIFFFQDWLVKRPRLTDGLRIAFLTFTLFGIGFYANAQLSVVNVMTFFNALITDFSWEYFLMEPLIFVLWFAVAGSLLFWGRGPFCGWLCPFGALQELLNRAAKLVRIPQVAVPWWLHERLWPLKYMIFLVLFGVSLYSLAWAEQLAEVEPFKTAIILKFIRDWPFVAFAVGLLIVGLFVERFYCRYLCPLGAALAIPGRLRTFEWLRRYRECGAPCQRCANECMVQAIHPEGHINPNECLYCLHCQTLYRDDRRCPVMIQKRLKRERRAALASDKPPTGAAALGGAIAARQVPSLPNSD